MLVINTTINNTYGPPLLVSSSSFHLFPPLFPPFFPILPPSIESALYRGSVAHVSIPSVLCTLQWGLARKDTSFTPDPQRAWNSSSSCVQNLTPTRVVEH
jgi:hypothetical protein